MSLIKNAYCILIFATSILALYGAVDKNILPFNPDKENMYLQFVNNAEIISDFGARDLNRILHYGVDFKANIESPVFADVNGRIRYVYPKGNNETKYIVLLHGETNNTNYGLFYLHIFSNSGTEKEYVMSFTQNDTNYDYRLLSLFLYDEDNRDYKAMGRVGIFARTTKISSGAVVENCYGRYSGKWEGLYYRRDFSDTTPYEGTNVGVVTNFIFRGNVVAPAGGSGGFSPHLHVSYGEFSANADSAATYSDGVNIWGNINLQNFFCSPYLFFNRDSFDYRIKFYKYPGKHIWDETEARSIYGNSARLFALVQSRTNYESRGNPDDEPTTRGADLNTVYFRIIPTANRQITEGNIRSWYNGTNENQLLAVFSYKGRGPFDFISNEINLTAASIYRFFTSTPQTAVINSRSSAQDLANGEDYIHVWTNNQGIGQCVGFDVFALNTWDTRAAAIGVRNTSGAQLAQARNNLEARYPDGEYVFMVQTKRVHQRNANWIGVDDSAERNKRIGYMNLSADSFVNQGVDQAERRKIVIDNFAPYIESVEYGTYSSLPPTANYRVIKRWTKNDAGQYTVVKNVSAVADAPSSVDAQSDLALRFNFSEYMSESQSHPVITMKRLGADYVEYYQGVYTPEQSRIAWKHENGRSSLSVVVPSASVPSNTTFGNMWIYLSGVTDVNTNSLDTDPRRISVRGANGFTPVPETIQSWKENDREFVFIYGNRDKQSLYVENVEVLKSSGDKQVINFDTKYAGNEAQILYKLVIFDEAGQTNRTEIKHLAKSLTSGEKSNCLKHRLQIESTDEVNIKVRFSKEIKQSANKPALVFVRKDGTEMTNTLEPNQSAFPTVQDWSIKKLPATELSIAYFTEFYIWFSDTTVTTKDGNLQYDANPTTVFTNEPPSKTASLRYFIPGQPVMPLMAKVLLEKTSGPQKGIIYMQSIKKSGTNWEYDKTTPMQLGYGDYRLQVMFVDALIKMDNTGHHISVRRREGGNVNGVKVNEPRRNFGWKDEIIEVPFGAKKILTPVKVWKEEFSIPEASSVDDDKYRISYFQTSYSEISESKFNPIMPRN